MNRHTPYDCRTAIRQITQSKTQTQTELFRRHCVANNLSDANFTPFRVTEECMLFGQIIGFSLNSKPMLAQMAKLVQLTKIVQFDKLVLQKE